MPDYFLDEPAHLQDGLAPDETPSDVWQIRCAWCGKDLGTKPATDRLFRISHSVCPACYDRLMAEADAEPLEHPF